MDNIITRMKTACYYIYKSYLDRKYCFVNFFSLSPVLIDIVIAFLLSYWWYLIKTCSYFFRELARSLTSMPQYLYRYSQRKTVPTTNLILSTLLFAFPPSPHLSIPSLELVNSPVSSLPLLQPHTQTV